MNLLVGNGIEVNGGVIDVPGHEAPIPTDRVICPPIATS